MLENTQKGRWTVIAEALGTNRTAAGELPTFFPNSHIVSTSETVPLTRVCCLRIAIQLFSSTTPSIVKVTSMT